MQLSGAVVLGVVEHDDAWLLPNAEPIGKVANRAPFWELNCASFPFPLGRLEAGQIAKKDDAHSHGCARCTACAALAVVTWPATRRSHLP